ncbi:MAG: SH3 domain protein [Candidatus Magnetoglobus multicellularis str. Araruama]|uniref:SH3 domain protein n=1 Tax=Candidatus Magnetoglobus multicellularis str. Araruama TaxID=890399 RepID=A0A1V1PH78_9BACT|nr:MAG: SH3 domain protein [Candidatus Magnetoglobus multicellularis str. Araruama]
MKMKISVYFVLTCCLFITTMAYSENRYVTERMRITLRTGPDVSYKVIGLVGSGESVELLEGREQWSRVETEDGKVGWVMTRFLSTDTPKSDLLETLQKEHERLKNKAKSYADENSKLKTENLDIKKELSKKVIEFNQLNQRYEALNKGCQKYKELKIEHDKVAGEMKKRQAELVQLKEEKAVLESNQLFWGFGLALGVLAAGFMIGKTSQKKRSGRLF